MELKDYVYNERIKRRMSQRELSRLSGISPAEVSRLEKGQRESPSSKVLIGLADAFKTTPAEIMSAIGMGPTEPPVDYIVSDGSHEPILIETQPLDNNRLVQEPDDPVAITPDGEKYLKLDGLDESAIRRLMLYAERLRNMTNKNQ